MLLSGLLVLGVGVGYCAADWLRMVCVWVFALV